MRQNTNFTSIINVEELIKDDDVKAFRKLVETLGLGSSTAIHIVAVWKWLDYSCGYQNVDYNTLFVSNDQLFHDLAREAIHVVDFLLSGDIADELYHLKLTPYFLGHTDFSFEFIYQNRHAALDAVQKFVVHENLINALARGST